jgi:RND family efflux transporter MFP subunit
MQRKTTIPKTQLLALAAALSLAACEAEHAPRPAAEAPSGPPTPVTTVEVVRIEAEHQITVPATVHPRQKAALAARIPASVAELPFREGQWVEKEAVVVRLDDAALRSAVVAAEAAVRAAEADLARMQSLVAKGAATQRELDNASTGAAGARAALLGAQDNLSYAELRAPFSGRVASRPVNLGDVVSPGTTLIEIEGAGGFEVRADLESSLVAGLSPGQKLEVRVDGQEAPLGATVRSISPSGDPATHRFEVKADLASASGLRSGLFARLILTSPSATARLTVPASAVFPRGGLSGVFVVADGRAHLRWVAPGAIANGVTEIRAGLEAGERVVLEPADLTDRAPVVESR